MTKVSVANTHYKSSYSCWYLIEWCNDIGLNCRLQPVQPVVTVNQPEIDIFIAAVFSKVAILSQF